MKGKFITFEGGEGSGKSTQIKLLKQSLESQGKTVLVTREPGGTPIGEKIRAILVGGNATIHPQTELLLFSALRNEHMEIQIKPALERGDWVLCDRFIDSTTVYQGFGSGLNIRRIQWLHDFTLNTAKEHSPDLTFLLDIDVEVGLKRSGRIDNTETRFESRGFEYHQKVRDGFLQLVKLYPRIKVIDALSDPDVVQEDIWNVLIRQLEL